MGKGDKKEKRAKKERAKDRAVSRLAWASFAVLCAAVAAAGLYQLLDGLDDEARDLVFGGRFQRFSEWPEKAKMQAPPHIGLIRRKGWGWALQAQAGIDANESLLAIPPEASITVQSVTSSKRLKPVFQTYQDEIEEFLGDSDVLFHQFALVVGILVEKELSEASFFHDWLDVLPAAPRNDLYWSKEELQCLPKVAQRAAARRRALVERMEAGIDRFFRPRVELLTNATLDVKWAYSTVIARSWWREAPQHLAVYPVFDAADRRVRQGRLWLSLPPNAKLLTDEKTRLVHIVSSVPLETGKYVSISPLSPLLPSDSVPAFGVPPFNFTHISAHIDVSSVVPECPQEELHFFSNGSATPRTAECLLKYRGIPPDAPAAVVAKTLNKFFNFHAVQMLDDWMVSSEGRSVCSRAWLENKPHGAEILSLIDAHASTFAKVFSVYGGKT
ncbi:hypothetical protein DIPPA_14023 [Diplonema papillatum]|nr:hypothetical protein DIPPA_14023 [Diplonema papillatum]